MTVHVSRRLSSSVARNVLDTHPTITNLFSNQSRLDCEARLERCKSIRPPWTVHEDKAYAVLVPLLNINNKPSLLFQLRSTALDSHRGEVSFPGGSIDPGENPVTAALREAHEEMGLESRNVEVWGQMQPSLAKNLRHLVTPVLAKLDDSVSLLDLVPHEHEVQQIFTRKISSLCSVNNVRHTQFRLDHKQEIVALTKMNGYSLPAFVGGTYRIWGLTAVILDQVLKIVVPDLYESDVKFIKQQK